MSDETTDGELRDVLEEVRAAIADLPTAIALAARQSEGVLEESALDLRTLHLVRAAALAATGAPASAWQVNLELMEDQVDADEIEGVLRAIVPIIGTSRYLSAVEAIIES